MFSKKLFLILVAALFGTLFSAESLAQGNTCPGCSEPDLTAIPKSFGPNTHSSWRSKLGLPGDPNDPSNIAFFFQKANTSADPGRAIFQFEGFDGQPATSISTLAFDRRTDGASPLLSRVCWSIRIGIGAPTDPKAASTFYTVGNFALPDCPRPVDSTYYCGPKTPPVLGWERCTWTAATPPTSGVIISIALMLSAGDTVETLDNVNIHANSNRFGPCNKTWGSPSDNNKPCNSP